MRGIRSSRSANIVTTANASLISKRSTCSTVQPTLSSSFRIASTGAVVNHSGCWLNVAAPTISATGWRFRVVALRARRDHQGCRSVADARGIAGRDRPLRAKRRLEARSLASSNFAGPSSTETTVVFPFRVISIGTISSWKTPSAIAWRARMWLRTAKSSCSRRLNSYFEARTRRRRSPCASGRRRPRDRR